MLLIAAAFALFLIVSSVFIYYVLRTRKKQSVALALAVLAVYVTFMSPIGARPVELAWDELQASGKQKADPKDVAPSNPADSSRVENPEIEAIRPGWGPPRAMYSEKNPAPHVTINSIADNSFYGDERVFFTVKKIKGDCTGGTDGGWGKSVLAEPGDGIVFRVIFENSVADNLDADGSHTVTGLRLRLIMPNVIGDFEKDSGGQRNMHALIDSDNATPKTIWSSTVVSSAEPVRLLLNLRSSALNNNYFKDPKGTPLGDAAFQPSGVLLGYDALDGRLRAGYRYAGYAYFCFTVSR